ACSLDQDYAPRLVGGGPLQMLMGVLDHDNGRIDHGADGNGDAAQAHNVGGEPERVHANVGDQYTDRQGDNGDQRAPHMEKKHHTDESHDGAFLNERASQGFNGPINQARAVIDRNNGRALGQARCDFGDALLDIGDDGKRILPVALHGDARSHFALAVQLRNATSFVRGQFDPGDVPQQDGRSALRLEHNLLKIVRPTQVALAAHHELGLGQLYHASTHVHVGGTNGVSDPG